VAEPGHVTIAAADRDLVTWPDLDEFVAILAGRVGRDFDIILAIARGGLIPAGMLAYRLGIRAVLVAAVAYYDEQGNPANAPELIQFPPVEALAGRRVLIVDEVWDTGATIALVTERVRAAGGTATTAVLHYKPGRSRVEAVPDHFAVTTDAWVVYPFKAGG
jgi:hypoxanthine phosphoribosyltransferase